MPTGKPMRRQRGGGTATAVLIYLICFALMLMALLRWYLIPALSVYRNADAASRKLLSAQALLVLSLVLFVLFIGLLWTFKIGRLFFPRKHARAKPTKYIDAWAEAGRRMKTPDKPDE